MEIRLGVHDGDNKSSHPAVPRIPPSPLLSNRSPDKRLKEIQNSRKSRLPEERSSRTASFVWSFVCGKTITVMTPVRRRVCTSSLHGALRPNTFRCHRHHHRLPLSISCLSSGEWYERVAKIASRRSLYVWCGAFLFFLSRKPFTSVRAIITRLHPTAHYYNNRLNTYWSK